MREIDKGQPIMIEPILLTKLHVINVANTPVTQLMPVINLVAEKYNLNPKSAKHLSLILRYITKRVLLN
jgi:hypothetical protein